MIYAAIIGLVIGVIAGIYCPYSIPPEYARLLAVAVMAGLDAVLGYSRLYGQQLRYGGFYFRLFY